MKPMTRLTRKRLAWALSLVAFPFNAALGDWHYGRWGGHPWRADLADRLDRELRRHP